MKRILITGILLLSCTVAIIAVVRSDKPRATRTATPLASINPQPYAQSPTSVSVIGEANKPQTVDVISGKPIDRSVYADFGEERVYFCCGQSRTDFMKNSAGYLAKIHERGIQLERVKAGSVMTGESASTASSSTASSSTVLSSTASSVTVKGERGKLQSVDVISGKPIDKNFYADYNGERVYFCCAQSKTDFSKNSEAYLKEIRTQGILLAKSAG
jgi:YHS domain-containing protein